MNGAWTWTSSNEDAAIVDDSGVVTVKNRGETTLTASYLSDTTVGQASVTLTVQPKSLSGAVVEVSREYPYTGFAWRPFDRDVTVTLDGTALLGGRDYGFQGTEAKDEGTYTLTEFYEPDFVLPESLTAIEASAFEGVASLTVVDAANCTSIGADAFKGTGLVQIRLPKDCGFIGTPFDDDALIDVFAPAGGSTQDYCNDPAHVNLIFVAE